MRGKVLIILGAILLASAAYKFMVRGNQTKAFVDTKIVQSFTKWRSSFSKHFSTPAEVDYRMQIFKKNLEMVEQHNSNTESTFTLGLNHLSALTEDELAALFSESNPEDEAKHFEGKKPVTRIPGTGLQGMSVPDSVDWSETLSPVKFLDRCSGCYATAAAESVEASVYFLKRQKVVMSAQDIIDCSQIPPYGNKGCNGGSIGIAYKYVRDKGLAYESEYPWNKGRDGSCQDSKRREIGKDQIDFVQVAPNRSDILKGLVAFRPISIKIAMSGQLAMYRKGIFSGACTGPVTMHVSLVGYGVSELNGAITPYWLIKTSQGTGWGENGYLRLFRSEGGVSGMCGVTDFASFSFLK